LPFVRIGESESCGYKTIWWAHPRKSPLAGRWNA
jgi:hypothetical protein